MGRHPGTGKEVLGEKLGETKAGGGSEYNRVGVLEGGAGGLIRGVGLRELRGEGIIRRGAWGEGRTIRFHFYNM